MPRGLREFRPTASRPCGGTRMPKSSQASRESAAYRISTSEWVSDRWSRMSRRDKPHGLSPPRSAIACCPTVFCLRRVCPSAIILISEAALIGSLWVRWMEVAKFLSGKLRRDED
jgi:hypothetical protein